MSAAEHPVLAIDPLSDEDGGSYAVHVSESRRVHLTPPLRTLLAACHADHRSPVLVTDAGATLSGHVVSAMRVSGGSWAVRTDDGIYDGLRGARIGDFADLTQPHDAPTHPAYEAAAPPSYAAVMTEAMVTRRAEASTAVGQVADQLLTALGGAVPDRWGLDEPLTLAADHDRMTASIRAQMPVSQPHLVGAPDGSFAAITVARTRNGLLERVRGGVPAGAWSEVDGAALAERAGQALRALAEAHQVTVAFVSVAPTGSLPDGECQRPGRRPPERPLAVVLGARAVHDLAPDLGALRAHLDVAELGRARVPSLLLQVREGDGWRQLGGALEALDHGRLEVALGIDGPFLDRLFGRPGAGR